MELRTLAISAALLAAATISRADITHTTLADDGMGVIACMTYDFRNSGPDEWQLNISGTHNFSEPGHVQGGIFTDTELDPSLTLFHSIDNTTTIPWSGYNVLIKMNKTFTLSSITVDNPGWNWAVTQPTQVGSDWIGTIQYTGGATIAPSGTLDFGYKMTFLGSLSFFEELTPISVPEPSTAVLALCGLAGFWALRKRQA